LVSAVVDQNVHHGHGLPEPFPEPPVGLIANVDRRLDVLIHPAGWLDVHPVKPTARPEVVLPHQQTAAAVDADLDDRDLATDELVQVAVIEFKVMQPLPHPRSFLHAIEIGSQGVARRFMSIGGRR
jgi:hypothetical protein